jgi:hypothetical protein
MSDGTEIFDDLEGLHQVARRVARGQFKRFGPD